MKVQGWPYVGTQSLLEGPVKIIGNGKINITSFLSWRIYIYLTQAHLLRSTSELVFCLSHWALNPSGHPGHSVPLASVGPKWLSIKMQTYQRRQPSCLLGSKCAYFWLLSSALIDIPDPGRYPGLQPHLLPPDLNQALWRVSHPQITSCRLKLFFRAVCTSVLLIVHCINIPVLSVVPFCLLIELWFL